MKRPSLFSFALATALTLPALSGSAQTTSDPTASDQTASTQRQSGSLNVGELDSKTSGANIRISQLMGLNIQNLRGESVGKIDDLVMDSNTGKIRYAAVTYGGLFGFGDKLFAVPFEAFKVMQDPDDPNDPDDFVMVLEVTKEQMEGAQGFDQDNWPNMADKNMLRDLDKRYGVDRAKMRNRDGRQDREDVDVDVNRRDADGEVVPK